MSYHGIRVHNGIVLNASCISIGGILNTLTKVFVGANALVYIAFGPLCYFWPEEFASQLDIALNSATALADFRAMYGGIPLGVGVVMLLGVLNAAWMRSALMLAVLCAAGLMVGRLLTLADTGGVTMPIYVFLSLEVGTVAIGYWLYRKLPTQSVGTTMV
jgi:hypothetical protein